MLERKKYSKEYKLDAVSLVTDQGYSRAEAARSLGINSNMLCRWVQEENAGAGQVQPALLRVQADEHQRRHAAQQRARRPHEASAQRHAG